MTSAGKARQRPRKTRGSREGESPPFFFAARRLAVDAGKRVTQAPVSDPSVKREPVFNIPGVIVALLALMAVIHVVRTLLLTPAASNDVLWLFAFDPAALRRRRAAGRRLAGRLRRAKSGPSSPIRSCTPTGRISASTRSGFSPSAPRWRAASAPRASSIFFAVTAAAGAIAHLFAYAGRTRR